MGIDEILLLVKIFNIFAELTADQLYRIKRDIDTVGRVVTTIVHMIDSDGDGEADTEETLLSFDLSIPDLSTYSLVNKGDEIGLGYPALKTLDSSEVFPVLQDLDDYYISDGEGLLIDYDNDGAVDDILYPSPYDFTGDGVPDFQIVVDDDENGVPDVAPDSPFYPVGSEEYTEIIERLSDEEVPALDKHFSNYNVSEALLMLILLFLLFTSTFRFLFRRRIP